MKKLLCMFICVLLLTACGANTEKANTDLSNPAEESITEATMSPVPAAETPEPTPELTPAITPEPTSEPTPEPTLAVTPEPSPTETPEPTPTDTPAPDTTPEYELESITEKRYEKNGSYIEFDDLPENDAETIVCNDLLTQITGPEKSAEEWIKVEEVSTLSFEELTESESYEELFKSLRSRTSSNVEYDDYVKGILNNGCVVVCVEYSNKHTEEMKLLQLSDGEHEEYWLFVPDENNQLKVLDNTRYYGLFNIYDGTMPDALIVN